MSRHCTTIAITAAALALTASVSPYYASDDYNRRYNPAVAKRPKAYSNPKQHHVASSLSGPKVSGKDRNERCEGCGKKVKKCPAAGRCQPNVTTLDLWDYLNAVEAALVEAAGNSAATYLLSEYAYSHVYKDWSFGATTVEQSAGHLLRLYELDGGVAGNPSPLAGCGNAAETVQTDRQVSDP